MCDPQHRDRCTAREDQGQRAEPSVNCIGHETSSLGKEKGDKREVKWVKAEAPRDDGSHLGTPRGWGGGSRCVSRWEPCDDSVRNPSTKKGQEGDCYPEFKPPAPSLSSLGRKAVFLPRLVLWMMRPPPTPPPPGVLGSSATR